jgi:hypothetical protein
MVCFTTHFVLWRCVVSKSALVKNSWDFKVSVTVPCPECKEFKPEPEVKLHSRYVYGEGYFKLHCCETCFEARVKELISRVKPIIYGY